MGYIDDVVPFFIFFYFYYILQVGWTLLALSVALVNAGSGLTALYILLTCVGFAIFLLFPGKMVFRWLAKVTGSSTVFLLTRLPICVLTTAQLNMAHRSCL
jgi:Kef-type K+ transport system membrane component KefB